MGSTYRLKRKLNDEGVELGGRRATENFCLIGTPLPPLEKSKDSGEFVPVWKQDVRDEQGRRRLHGAFTGGFSAGYFNTVGSKEGWTPQTFVSSRSDRTKKKVARPEDYMDEEDLAELRENQVKSGIQEKMDLLGGTQAELGRLDGTGDEEDDSMTRRIERTLIAPTNDSPGARLLRKMGWRPGHGVGPRVSWRQRKIQDLHAQGKSLEGVDIDKLEDDEEAKKHMYPPRDTQVPKISRKENAFGLGYLPGLGLNQSSGKGEGTKKQSGPQLSAGFGLGALNDAEDDDIDVYESNVQAGRTRMAYDTSDRDADDTISIGASSKRRHTTDTAAVDANSRFWPDGTPVLKGFVPASSSVQTSQWFPLPEIPKGWKPDPKRVWDKAKENVAPPPPTEAGVKGQSKLTAEQRGQALGETPLPTAPRSIFDYISAKDRERIQKLASGASEIALPPPPPTPTSVPFFPFTPPDVASAALKGYMPFPTDPVKQSRYIAYLRSQADPSSTLTPKPLPNQAPDVFHKEMEEYAKSAALFKPMSGAMAGRFTSAAVVDNGPKIIEGLYQPVHPPSPPPLSEEEKAKAKERERQELAEKRMEEEMAEGSKGHAAKMGMYGPLTREVKPWQPSKLLCKRFGVKDPNPDVSTETPMPGVSPTASAGAGPSTASGSQAQGGIGWQPEQALAEAGISLEEAGLSETTASGPGGSGSSRRGRKDLENVGLGEDEDQGRDTLTYVRPSMDVFKAIFASDDEDSGDDEEDAGGTKKDEGIMKADEDVEMKVAESKTLPVAGPSRLKDNDEAHLPMNVDSTNGSNAPHEKVDLASFKPTFIPRAERETKKSKDKSKEKKSKKSKVIVSFDTEEDGGGGLSIAPKKSSDKDKDGESKKKKRRKDKEKEREKGKVQEDDEDMWVEKPPPEAVKTLQSSMARSESPMVISDSGDGPNSSGTRGRKRAVDFM